MSKDLLDIRGNPAIDLSPYERSSEPHMVQVAVETPDGFNDRGAAYVRVKMGPLTVPVLSENSSCSIPMDRRMLRCTLDMRVSVSLQ